MQATVLLEKVKSVITLQKLSGYRTYFAVILGIIVAGLKAKGYIDENTFQLMESTLGLLGLAGLRAAKSNSPSMPNP